MAASTCPKPRNLGDHYGNLAPILLHCIEQTAQLSGLWPGRHQPGAHAALKELWGQRSIALISRGMCHIRLCTSVHLAALRAAGVEAEASMLSGQVLTSSTFGHLKGLSDVGLKQLCHGTCQTMLEGLCGEVLQRACLQQILGELQERPPQNHPVLGYSYVVLLDLTTKHWII
ncbi:unnamed protein product [Cladocopium goreaui]|uniref:Uncharacterized protein n=1 Tax=Cladocopium goreaui TaxID=2562237 RepID=A0A9P1BJY2_9DINO|nr:unnamed protein product [Cladocopium goreaui]